MCHIKYHCAEHDSMTSLYCSGLQVTRPKTQFKILDYHHHIAGTLKLFFIECVSLTWYF